LTPHTTNRDHFAERAQVNESRSARTVVHRVSARVLLFHTSGQLLLMEGSNPVRPQAGRWWFPIGGSVEEGEDLPSAIVREVHEEAGITNVRLGPLVWLRTADFPYQHDMHLVQREHYFVGLDIHRGDPAYGPDSVRTTPVARAALVGAR
jgi:8-oxo-dGTP pyrophosphatase MutT (NUDIX family)